MGTLIKGGFVKVWVFWEGHKIWKNLCCTFDKSIMICAHNRVLVKKSMNGMEGMDQKKCGQVILYKIYINCSECQNKNKKQFAYSTCSQHVLSLEFSCTELIIQWTIFCHTYYGLVDTRNKYFWKRFTCNSDNQLSFER